MAQFLNSSFTTVSLVVASLVASASQPALARQDPVVTSETNLGSYALPPRLLVGNKNIPDLTKKQTTLDGNPEFGTVHHLAQTHAVAGLDGDELVKIGQVQALMIKSLKDLKVQLVFIEGYPVGEVTDSTALDHQREQLEQAFPNKQIPDFLTTEQSLLLSASQIDTARLIKYFYPEMILRGTEPIDHSQQYAPDLSNNAEFVLVHREQVVMQAVMDYLKTAAENHKEFALIYGADHVFSNADIPENLSHAEKPLVFKHSHSKWTIYEDTQRVTEAASEQLQLLELRSCTRVYSYSWLEAKSTKVQLQLLPKLKVTTDEFASIDDLKNYLTSNIVGEQGRDEVERSINIHMNDKTGPFSDLTVRPGSEDLFNQVKGAYASVVIMDERHAYTQLELVKAAPPILEGYIFFSLASDIARMSALDKMILSPGQTKEMLKDDLMRDTISRDIRQEIQRRFDNQETPFKCDK